MPGWLKTILAVALAGVTLAAIGIAVLAVVNAPRSPDDVLSRNSFRCLAVSESFRTVAQNRIDRKTLQLTRIRRLLTVKGLEPLDEAKLRSELAILTWEVEDSRFLRDCAEAYYKPGSTQLRETFTEGPALPSYDKAREILLETRNRVVPRMLPHGYDNRANLYLATAALNQGDLDDAVERAQSYVADSPDGLYADSLKLVIADAHLSRGNVAEALAIYQQVGRLKIGLDAHYARYKAGMIMRANGNLDEGEQYLDDVRKWADRGDRQALGRFLKGGGTAPPRAR